VCNSHGGAARQVKAAAARREASAAAAEACQWFGLPVDTTPEAALQDELNRTAGAVAWLRAEVAALGPAAIGTALWDLYGYERDHLVTVCRVMLAADVQGRAVDLAREVGARVAGAMDAILEGLQLTPGQRALVPEVVPRAIRLLDPAPPDGAA
jgi:hypothetical protein